MNDSDLLVAVDAKANVAQVAKALMAGDLPFLEGVRRLLALRAKASSQSHDPDFMLFVAIARQADHIPHQCKLATCAHPPGWQSET